MGWRLMSFTLTPAVPHAGKSFVALHLENSSVIHEILGRLFCDLQRSGELCIYSPGLRGNVLGKAIQGNN
ncbi:hypothetical protein Scep_025973 [Stephania cephalantha]|uniref:Uncharacterized protein n=1 Tax=Stephania cephalantha TaxID=152367 RepID=A0AAP0EJP1_9MAGN